MHQGKFYYRSHTECKQWEKVLEVFAKRVLSGLDQKLFIGQNIFPPMNQGAKGAAP